MLRRRELPHHVHEVVHPCDVAGWVVSAGFDVHALMHQVVPLYRSRADPCVQRGMLHRRAWSAQSSVAVDHVLGNWQTVMYGSDQHSRQRDGGQPRVPVAATDVGVRAAKPHFEQPPGGIRVVVRGGCRRPGQGQGCQAFVEGEAVVTHVDDDVDLRIAPTPVLLKTCECAVDAAPGTQSKEPPQGLADPPPPRADSRLIQVDVVPTAIRYGP